MNVTKVQRERAAIVRTSILAHIRAYTQVSLSDLCREFEIDEAAATVHLQALRAKKQIYRASSFTTSSTLGQIWAIGQQPERGPGSTFTPIQVTVRHWAGEAQSFRRTALEHLLCFARPQAEAI